MLAGNTPVLVHNECGWAASPAEIESIEDRYGEAVANGVEYNVNRFNDGATGHALNGIGADTEETARYLAQPRTYNYRDTRSGGLRSTGMRIMKSSWCAMKIPISGRGSMRTIIVARNGLIA